MKFFSKSKSNETAKVIQWNPKWDTKSPIPQVLSKDGKTFLMYLIHEDDPAWKEAFQKKLTNAADSNLPIALVEFSNSTFKFGTGNSDVFTGLSLWGKGLEAHQAHVVEKSAWIEEIKSIHKVYPYYREKSWKDLKHYMLLFKDSIFECISSEYKIETFNTTFKDLTIEVANRVNS